VRTSRRRVDRQRVVEVELEEPHQAGAALRLLDQGAELLIGTARRELAEQLRDIGLADTAEDPIQDTGERPVSSEDVAAHHHIEHSFGCHGLLLLGQVTGLMLVSPRGMLRGASSRSPRQVADLAAADVGNDQYAPAGRWAATVPAWLAHLSAIHSDDTSLTS
jgi:hypothetical protein